MPERWHTITIGDDRLDLLNLDHPEVNERVIEEIDAGVEVYYDTRWSATERFCRLLVERPDIVSGKDVLIIGAGVGLETVVIGRLCNRLYINDLAPVSVQLCGEQLERNGVTDYATLPGSFDLIDIPEVDIIVGCFVVYDPDTREALDSLLAETDIPVLLVNEELDAFRTFISETPHKIEHIGPHDGPTVVILRP